MSEPTNQPDPQSQPQPSPQNRDQRLDAIDSNIDVVDDGAAQGNAGGGGGQWMRIFVPDVANQGALLHLGKPGAGGVGYRGVTLQAQHDVMISAVQTLPLIHI